MIRDAIYFTRHYNQLLAWNSRVSNCGEDTYIYIQQQLDPTLKTIDQTTLEQWRRQLEEFGLQLTYDKLSPLAFFSTSLSQRFLLHAILTTR